MTAEIEVIGDPYYIADSGMGNFSDIPSSFNETQSGAMNYQSGEVDIIVNFRTPTDYNSLTGQMDFMSGVENAGFSGLYNVQEVTNMFKGGKFTQTLKAIRRPVQEPAKTQTSAEQIIAQQNASFEFCTTEGSEQTRLLAEQNAGFDDDGNSTTQAPGEAPKKAIDSVSRGSKEGQVEYTNSGTPIPGRPRGGS
jgi:hypothetical protein